jgi:hypothetical protein
MLPSEVFKEFQQIAKAYNQLLTRHSAAHLKQKPDALSWSLGQVFFHLSNETFNYGFLQVDKCLTSNRNKNGSKTEEGEIFYKRGGFDNVRIKSPTKMEPTLNFTKDELRTIIRKAESEMKGYARKISDSSFQGKAKHPGLGFLSASEWYFFITKHWLHHLRQVNRIEKFLQKSSLIIS